MSSGPDLDRRALLTGSLGLVATLGEIGVLHHSTVAPRADRRRSGRWDPDCVLTCTAVGRTAVTSFVG